MSTRCCSMLFFVHFVDLRLARAVSRALICDSLRRISYSFESVRFFSLLKLMSVSSFKSTI